MSSYDNRHLTPSFSKEFEDIHALWKTHLEALRHIVNTSAFNSRHYDGKTFEANNTVLSFTDILEALQAFLDFLRIHGLALKAEAHRYLEEHRAFLWFYYGMQCLYHPSPDDRRTYPMFMEGTLCNFDLSLATYEADKARKEERGKTKNPDFVDTHVCCSNCICFYDDTPPYECAKEDAAEAKASNNIRINSHKKAEFEQHILGGNMLEVWHPYWSSWTPPRLPTRSLRSLDPYWVTPRTTTASMATDYARTLEWFFPCDLYFSFLWDMQDAWEHTADKIEETLAALRDRYVETKVWEDEVVEAAHSNVRVFRLS